METSSVNLLEVGVKAKSKVEVYKILTINKGIYLMPEKECSMAFISEICFQRKKCLFFGEVTVCTIPHVGGLRSENIIDFIIRKLKAKDYLPSNYIDHKPSRVWLCNVANSLNSDAFMNFVNKVLDDREKYILNKRNLTINIDSRIAELFSSSQMISVNKGKSHKLLRKTLLKDSLNAKMQKEEELKEKCEAIPALHNEINHLKTLLSEKDQEVSNMKNDSKILERLYEQGIIDANGDPIEKLQF